MGNSLRFVAMALFLAAGAGAIWWVRSANHDIPGAFASSSSLANIEVGESVRALDGKVANMIRTPSNINWDNFSFGLPEAMSDASHATISATFATTPAEFWQDMRERGAQEALGSVMSQAQVKAGEVSTEIVNEARYQYCKGVVSAYEGASKNATP